MSYIRERVRAICDAWVAGNVREQEHLTRALIGDLRPYRKTWTGRVVPELSRRSETVIARQLEEIFTAFAAETRHPLRGTAKDEVTP